MAVTEVEGGDYLSEEPPGFLWRESSFLDEIIEQFSAGNVFQDQVQILFVLVNVVQSQHVRMFDQLHDCYLALHLE